MKKLKKALVVMLAVLCLLLSGCSFGREVRRAEEKIASIGIVTAESGPVIEEAEAAMDALSQKEREKVKNAADLIRAKEDLRRAIEEKEERERQERLEALRRSLVGEWEFTQDVTEIYCTLLDRMMESVLGYGDVHMADYVDRIALRQTFSLLENGAYEGIEPFNSGNVYLFRNNGEGSPGSSPAEPGEEVEPTTRRYATDPNVPVIPIKTEPVTTAPVTDAPEATEPTLPNIKPKPDPPEYTHAPVVTCAPTVKPTGKKTDSKIIENQAKSSASSAPMLNIKTATLKCGKRFNINVYHKNGRKVTFKSTVKKVASVNKNGVVTTLKKGRAKVLVTVGSVTLRCIVKVTSSPRLSKSGISVKKGKTAAVNIIGKAKGVNNKYKNTEYARIVSKKSEKVVRVKGIKRGTTTVKVVVNKLALKLKVKVK